MNIQAGRSFGAQSMAAPLKRVLMRSAASAMRRADRREWHYGPGFDPARAGCAAQGFRRTGRRVGRRARMAARCR